MAREGITAAGPVLPSRGFQRDRGPATRAIHGKDELQIPLRRGHFLNLLAQDLERISSQLDPSRVARFALRKVGEVLRADLAVQVDVNRADGMLQRPYLLALSPRA